MRIGVRGEITGVSPDVLKVHANSGENVVINLTNDTKVRAVTLANIEDIKTRQLHRLGGHSSGRWHPQGAGSPRLSRRIAGSGSGDPETRMPAADLVGSFMVLTSGSITMKIVSSLALVVAVGSISGCSTVPDSQVTNVPLNGYFHQCREYRPAHHDVRRECNGVLVRGQRRAHGQRVAGPSAGLHLSGKLCEPGCETGL